jgi:hypothetical protein
LGENSNYSGAEGPLAFIFRSCFIYFNPCIGLSFLNSIMSCQFSKRRFAFASWPIEASFHSVNLFKACYICGLRQSFEFVIKLPASLSFTDGVYPWLIINLCLANGVLIYCYYLQEIVA